MSPLGFCSATRLDRVGRSFGYATSSISCVATMSAFRHLRRCPWDRISSHLAPQGKVPANPALILKVEPMFDVAEKEFSWDAPWGFLEVKKVAQDFFYWLLTNIFRGPTGNIYVAASFRTCIGSLSEICKSVHCNVPSYVTEDWFSVRMTTPNFSDRKIEQVIERLTLKLDYARIGGVKLWAALDAVMELLFARASSWSDALTLDDLLPQLTSGRMIQVYDEYRKAGLPLNIIAEHVLFYKRPIRSDEQVRLARALRDLGWKRHRTAQARRWIAPPDFPTRDRNNSRWDQEVTSL